MKKVEVMQNDKDGVFIIGDAEIEALRAKDKRLAWAIDRIERPVRRTNSNVFSSLIYSVVGQQVSMAAHRTLWARLRAKIDDVTPQSIANLAEAEMRRGGLSQRKVEYIKGIADAFIRGDLSEAALQAMSDEEAIQHLSALKGIGRWTAEMLLIFSLQRPDILSYDDLAIQRGMRMLYRHREITKPLFQKYRRRLSPFGSIASFYFWAIAGDAIPELTDPKKRR